MMQINNWPIIELGVTEAAHLSESPLESDAANRIIWKTSAGYKQYAHWMSVHSIFLLGV